MPQKPEIFRETQNAYWIFALFFLIGLFLFFRYDFNRFIYPAVLLILIALIFFRLTIVINHEEVMAYFGFGFFKRKMKISEIDYSSIQKIKIHWWTGIGIRITSYGWLYNVKLGEAIRIESTDKSKIFFVGTSEFSKIKQIISEHKEYKE